MMIAPSAEAFMRLAARRGEILARQLSTVARLLDTSPVDVSRVLSSAVLLAQGVSRAHLNLFGLIMAEPEFGAWPLDTQLRAATSAKLWADLWAVAGNLAFAKRLLLINAISPPIAGAAFTGPARGVALSVALEDTLNVAGIAGVTLGAFWSRSVSGIASLGRLLTIDGALAREYPFDPMGEGFQMDQGLLPRAVDAGAILQRIDKLRPRDYAEPLAGPSQAYTVTAGMDLFAFSSAVLGAPQAWRLIVDFNRLRFPYFSDNPLDQLGAPQGTLLLTAALPQGASRVTVVDASRVTIDHRLHVDDGHHAQVLTVLSVDAVTGEIEFAPSTEASMQIDAVVTLYLAEADVGGRVLQTGDVLLVPIATTFAGRSPVSLLAASAGSAIPTEESLYGIDVAVPLRVERGDLALITGRANLAQALRHRVMTTRGSLVYHPTYGAMFDPLIGRRHGPIYTFLTQVQGRQAVLADPRVASVSAMSIDADADTLDVAMTVVTKAEAQFQLSARARVRA